MNILEQVMRRLKLNPVQVFNQAYDYYEVRMKESDKAHVLSACFQESEGKLHLVGIPQVVIMYCVEVLAGLAIPLNPNSKEDNNEM